MVFQPAGTVCAGADDANKRIRAETETMYSLMLWSVAPVEAGGKPRGGCVRVRKHTVKNRAHPTNVGTAVTAKVSF